jgi:hypothetical protein
MLTANHPEERSLRMGWSYTSACATMSWDYIYSHRFYGITFTLTNFMGLSLLSQISWDYLYSHRFYGITFTLTNFMGLSLLSQISWDYLYSHRFHGIIYTLTDFMALSFRLQLQRFAAYSVTFETTCILCVYKGKATLLPNSWMFLKGSSFHVPFPRSVKHCLKKAY